MVTWPNAVKTTWRPKNYNERRGESRLSAGHCSWLSFWSTYVAWRSLRHVFLVRLPETWVKNDKSFFVTHNALKSKMADCLLLLFCWCMHSSPAREMPLFKKKKISKDESKRRVEKCLVVVSVRTQIVVDRNLLHIPWMLPSFRTNNFRAPSYTLLKVGITLLSFPKLTQYSSSSF